MSHKPLTTGEYYPAAIRRELLAAVGFQLMDDDKVPMPVLQAMSAHPDYQWSLPEEEEV